MLFKVAGIDTIDGIPYNVGNGVMLRSLNWIPR